MSTYRSHSVAFKRPVAQEFLGGETLHGLANRHDLSRNLIQIRVGKYEAGAFDEEVAAADLVQGYEARIAALERLAALPRTIDAQCTGLRRQVAAEHGLGSPAPSPHLAGSRQASQTLRHVAGQLRPRWPKLAAFIDDSEVDVLAHMDFPAQHRSKIHSTNPLERLNKEVKRRADVVGIFPNEGAIIRQIGAVLLEANEEWQLQHRYMQREPMADLMLALSDATTPQITTGAA